VVLDPPDSVRQVMRGYPGETRPDINEDAALDPVAVPVLPGFAFIGGDHQGTWLLNQTLQRTASPTAAFIPELDQVTADYFSAFRHEQTGAFAAVWRIRGGAAFSLTLRDTEWGRPDPPRNFLYFDGDLVLVAVGEGLDPLLVLQTITTWQSPTAAYEAAGLEGSPQQHRIGCLAP
jgi:hypothetical protein